MKKVLEQINEILNELWDIRAYIYDAVKQSDKKFDINKIRQDLYNRLGQVEDKLKSAEEKVKHEVP